MKMEMDEDKFIKYCLTKNNITDYGLSFLLEVMNDLVISKEFIETLYRVIVKIARTKMRELLPLPVLPPIDENGNEPSEEEK